jgi:endoglucanase
MKSVFIIAAKLMISFAGYSQGYLRRDGKKIVDANGKELLLRGMGLGGWMLQEPYMLQLSGAAGRQGDIRRKIQAGIGTAKTQEFYDAWLSNHCTRGDIDSLKAWGFNSVRLPMHYNLFTPPIGEEPIAGSISWIEKGFALTDSLLSWCGKNQLYLILDLHAAPGGQGKDQAISDYDNTKPSLWESRANQEKTIALWRKLAERYASEPWIGGYDLINETNWGFTDTADKNGCNEKINAPLRKLLVEITAAIRSVDKNHIIFIEANCWANNYSGIFPLWDDNMVVSFHKYWNYNDQQSLQNMLQIREQQGVPLWMGESGENSNLWFRDAISLLERNNIGWAWWPLKKLGANNPLQVNLDSNYIQLVRHWRGEGPHPGAENAFAGLMQHARNTHITNTIYHKDVIDAMFRQTRSDEVLPFASHTISNNSIVFAVDYDLGRNGFAYSDKDTANYWVSSGTRSDWNRGRVYRNDGVDIERINDTRSNGFGVTATEAGEWLQYTINVPEAGTYNIIFRTRAQDSSGNLGLSINHQHGRGAVVPQSTRWQNTTVRNVSLKQGTNIIRVIVDKGGFDLNYLKFEKKK